LHVPNPGQEDVEENSRPAHTTDKPKSDDNDGESDDPEDVFSEKDLVRGGISGEEMRADDGVGESGGHGEVGDGTDEQGYGEEVVEDFLAVARPEAKDVVG
jgi:hypothetical protein